MQLIGKLTLNRNPTNYFAETEQVAFHTGHLVPGIEVTNDPLMQARLFSYLDTQLTRLGGPNFTQLPINRPALPGQRHAARRHAPERRSTPASRPTCPNSIDGDRRSSAGRGRRRLRADAAPRRGSSVRAHPASFDDHFSQATLFYRSLTPIEQAHIVEAFTFELGKVLDQSDQGTRAGGAGQRRRRPLRPGRGRPRPAGAGGQAGRRRRALARAVADRRRARPDRRPQDRRHRRRRLRPRRHRQAAYARLQRLGRRRPGASPRSAACSTRAATRRRSSTAPCSRPARSSSTPIVVAGGTTPAATSS